MKGILKYFAAPYFRHWQAAIDRIIDGIIIYVFFFEQNNGSYHALIWRCAKANTMNKDTSTPYALSQKNLTWVLPTNKQILKEQMFEPLINNKAPLTKKRKNDWFS
jgi:hypothetical protein